MGYALTLLGLALFALCRLPRWRDRLSPAQGTILSLLAIALEIIGLYFILRGYAP